MGLIPARGGSKGIPKKNIRLLDGVPLISYSINAGISSNIIDDVFVSSDDSEILNISKNNGAKIIKRPTHLATNDASTHDVILHAINTLNKNNIYDLVILLQPTSPLRNEKHINEAYNLMLEKNSSSLISVSLPEKSPYKHLLINEKGFLKGIINNKMTFMNRQDLPKTYLPNGAIYIFSINDFLKKNRIPINKTVPYLMSKEESIDIDQYDDILIAEKYLKRIKLND